jgi:hypothetical protein
MAKKQTATPAAKQATPKLARDAVAAGTSAGPPYKCQTTLEPGVCLRFNRDPSTGQYNLPPEGIRVSCTDCQYWFDN